MQKRLHNNVSSHKCGAFIVIWTIFLFMLMCLFGCARQPDATETAAGTAHQTIQTIRESLPAQCKTKAIDEQLKTADSAIESVVSSCELQKQAITQEKVKWKWAFFALALIMLAYVGKKIVK